MVTTEQQPDLLTVAELQAYLRVSRATAYGLVARREVPSIRVGGNIRIPRAELDRQFATSMERKS
jgi:excisionase family DNA binding protein